MNFKDFLRSASKIKNIPLPAEASQFKMSPPYREKLIGLRKEKMKLAKQAATLALFYPDVSLDTKLVLILRKTYKGVHSAQVGFPGGKIEEQDTSLLNAAIRETYEEVGVEANKIEILKPLTKLYIPPSNFHVHPFIAITRNTPNFTKQDDEVEDIIEVALSDLLSDINITSKMVKTSYGIEVEVPAYKFNGHIVWGATAMMISEIKDLLKQVL